MAFLEVTTVSQCPNACVYCPQDLFQTKYNSDCNNTKFLSLENFKFVIDKLPKNSTISFAGFSEPFINENIVDMIQYAFEKEHSVWIFTTLIGLDISQYNKIKNYNYGYFSVHLPDDLGKTIVPISNNYIKTLEYLRDNIPNGLFAFHHHGGSLHNKIKDIIQNSTPIPVHDRAGNLENEESNIARTDKIKGVLKCNHAFLFNDPEGSCLMLPNGEAYLCCSDFGLKHRLGNLFEQSWIDIMNSDEMINVLKGLNDDDSDILCRYCTSSRKV